jgi:hypothetical protein
MPRPRETRAGDAHARAAAGTGTPWKMKRGLVVVVALLVAAFSATSLLSGADYLQLRLPGGLPLGNLLAALGLIAIAGAAFALSQAGTIARFLAGLAMVLSLAWLPASVLLAGDLALNFSGGTGSVWLAVTATTIFSAVLALVWAALHRLARALRRRRPPSSIR